jgi:hypothetical protein
MSTLRKHLHLARDRYDAQKYPGDLAAEVMGYRRGGGLAWWATIGCAAAAAVVALALWPGAAKDAGRVAVKTDAVAVAPATQLTGIPQFPSDLPAAPSMESMSAPSMSMPSMSMPALPAIPSFTSLEAQGQDISPTTQESA